MFLKLNDMQTATLERRDNEKNGIICALILATPFVGGCGTSHETLVGDFTAIIDNDGADPWIFQDEKYYYYTKTTGNNLTLWRSENLTEVAAGRKSHLGNACGV